MKPLRIDTDFLKGIKAVVLSLENCDVYKIKAEEVLDICCEVETDADREEKNFIKSGYIKLSKMAGVRKEEGEASSYGYTLKKRLEICTDPCYLEFITKHGKSIGFSVPYDPLLDIQWNEIEWSNCPSMEIDGDGNIIIYFGESSKKGKRKDNNYNELIVGWEKYFGEFLPKTAECEICKMWISQYDGLSVQAWMTFKGEGKKRSGEFLFLNCKNLDLDMLFPVNGTCEVIMSKRESGEIYVGFRYFEMEFECSSIWIYEEYKEQIKEKTGGKKL